MSTSLPLAGAGPGRRSLLFGLVLAALLGALAYLLGLSWPRLFAPPVFTATAGDGCNLRAGACAASFDQTRVIRLDIEPRNLPPSVPLRVQVHASGFDTDTVSIEFSGVDMNMGLVRSELAVRGNGLFVGDTILPVCVRRHMTWRATVTARGPDGMHKALFDFEVRRP